MSWNAPGTTMTPLLTRLESAGTGAAGETGGGNPGVVDHRELTVRCHDGDRPERGKSTGRADVNRVGRQGKARTGRGARGTRLHQHGQEPAAGKTSGRADVESVAARRRYDKAVRRHADGRACRTGLREVIAEVRRHHAHAPRIRRAPRVRRIAIVNRRQRVASQRQRRSLEAHSTEGLKYRRPGGHGARIGAGAAGEGIAADAGITDRPVAPARRQKVQTGP